VRAIGTDADEVATEIQSLLVEARFRVERIKISDFFKTESLLTGLLDETDGYRRYVSYMNAGDYLRSSIERADAAALLAVEHINLLRGKRTEPIPETRGTAFIITSLMHPEEVATLRRIYGPQLFVISLFSPREKRIGRLAKKLAAASGERPEAFESFAVALANRDEGIREPRADRTTETSNIPGLDPATYSQDLLAHRVADTLAADPRFLLSISKTYEKADLFVAVDDREETKRQLRRFVELVFSHPFHTPSRDEVAMAVAHLSGFRSSALSRQVGASITSEAGEVLALGVNEVARFGGGQYWEGDPGDGRDHNRGYDSSDQIRLDLFTDLMRRLCEDASWLPEGGEHVELRAALERIDAKLALEKALESALIQDARMFDVIEYGRAVHAEMAAICEAACRGVELRGASLYCTTFPCHDCARHVVAVGIKRVVYIEPYPKSRVAELYEDSIGLADRRLEVGNRVSFEPFVGIAPRCYRELFAFVRRKTEGNSRLVTQIVQWSIGNAKVRESIVDRETVESGSRAASIDAMEGFFVASLEKVRQNIQDRQGKLDLNDTE
jgi:deoxycytidylate deaminase